jgi:2-polyprenyl-6-methoxyphenol hydroxylase-like FAD-dependent oxidoreductase
MVDYEVLIVGGGPAGSITARLLGQARPELRILLCDAEATPRHRPCGEYLSPGGLRIVDRCGLMSAIMASGAHRLSAVALVSPGGASAVPFQPILGLRPHTDHGLGVKRECFDRVLQDGAAEHATLRRSSRILGFERVERHWEVRFADGSVVTTNLIIGADGRGSIVRRAAGLDREPRRRRFALVCRARGFAHRSQVEMHLGPLGQIGVCPLANNEVNFNLLLAPASSGLLRRMPRERLMRAAIAATPTLAMRASGAVCTPVMATGSLPQGSRSVVADGICLVGDASGFCDPFTGEGMSIAARGAECLADALADLDLSTMPDEQALSGYAEAFARAIGRRRKVGELLQGLLTRRRLSEGVAALLSRSPLVSGLLVADAAGFSRTLRAAASA